jgi:hypothetical protein
MKMGVEPSPKTSCISNIIPQTMSNGQHNIGIMITTARITDIYKDGTSCYMMMNKYDITGKKNKKFTVNTCSFLFMCNPN